MIQPSPTSTTLVLSPDIGFNMQSIADAITNAFPKPNVAVTTGVFVPIICMGGCKDTGIVNPEGDVKEVASRVYNYAMQMATQTLWNTLYALYEALKRFGLGVLDLTLPVLGLHVDDLFNPDLTCIIERAINNLLAKFQNAYDQFIAEIQRIFKILSIPWPLFQNLNSPEELIKYIVKHIVASLWDQLMKKFKLLFNLIELGLRLYDAVTKRTLAEIWQQVYNQIFKTVIQYFSNPPSLNDIKNALEKFAQQILKKAQVTYAEILSVLAKFKLPVFGNPLDWLLPINKHLNFPDVDFNKILNDIKLWLNNFVMNMIIQFIKAIEKLILRFFGITLKFPKIEIPFFTCTIKTT
jgi:hypothetical protein